MNTLKQLVPIDQFILAIILIKETVLSYSECDRYYHEFRSENKEFELRENQEKDNHFLTQYFVEKDETFLLKEGYDLDMILPSESKQNYTLQEHLLSSIPAVLYDTLSEMLSDKKNQYDGYSKKMETIKKGKN